MRATSDRAPRWPRSRFSARGPGWPACLDHGHGNGDKHVLGGNLAAWEPVCHFRLVVETRRLPTTARWRSFSHSLHINYITHLPFCQGAQAVLGRKCGRNTLCIDDLSQHSMASKIVLPRWLDTRESRTLDADDRAGDGVTPQVFRCFSDLQTAEMLDLPRPRLQGGKPIVVACPIAFPGSLRTRPIRTPAPVIP